MRLQDIRTLNEVFVPPTIVAFLTKYGSKVVTFVAIAVLEKLVEQLLKKLFVKKQKHLPDDLYYMGFGYSTKVPKNEITHAEAISNALRQELENKLKTDFSLIQTSDVSRMIHPNKNEFNDSDLYLLNSFLFGFKVKPNLKDITIKLKAGFEKLNIQIKITYYGKK